MRKHTLRFAIFFFAIAFPTASGNAKEASPTLVQFSKRHDLIVFPVDVRGKTWQFAFDTGASAHFIDESLAMTLGSQVGRASAKTAGDPVEVSLYNIERIAIKHHSLRLSRPVASLDLGFIREAGGCEAYGIIGAPLFRGHRIILDFDRSEIAISNSGTSSQHEDAVMLPFDLRNGMVRVVAKIGETEGIFLIDTGATGSIGLSADVFQDLLDSGEIELDRDTLVQTASGTMTLRTGTIGVFSLGPHRVNQVRVAESKSNHIGLGYLKRFLWEFDVDQRRVAIVPSKHFTASDSHHRVGIALGLVDGQVKVLSVDDKSPAHIAGMEPDDIFIEVAAKPISEFTLSEVWRVLKYSNRSEISVKVLRHGQTLNLRIRRETRQD